MRIPLQITVRDFPQSEALEATIRKKAGKLEKYYPRVTNCRVVVEESYRHQFQVSLDVRVPGGDIVVKRVCNEDAYVATRDAFNAARQQLDEAGYRQHGDAVRVEHPARSARFAGRGLSA